MTASRGTGARPPMQAGSPRCYCTVCGHIFLTHVSFDLHRGIMASDDEEHQDQGWCWPSEILEAEFTQYEPWVWGTDDEVATAERFRAMREVRASGK